MFLFKYGHCKRVSRKDQNVQNGKPTNGMSRALIVLFFSRVVDFVRSFLIRTVHFYSKCN